MEDRTWLVALEVARNFDTVGPPLPPAPGTPYHPPHVHTLPDVPVQSTRLAALPWRRSGLPEPQTPETPTSFGGFAGGVEDLLRFPSIEKAKAWISMLLHMSNSQS